LEGPLIVIDGGVVVDMFGGSLIMIVGVSLIDIFGGSVINNVGASLIVIIGGSLIVACFCRIGLGVSSMVIRGMSIQGIAKLGPSFMLSFDTCGMEFSYGDLHGRGGAS